MSAHPSLQSNQQHQDQPSDTLFLNAGLAERHKDKLFYQKDNNSRLKFRKMFKFAELICC